SRLPEIVALDLDNASASRWEAKSWVSIRLFSHASRSRLSSNFQTILPGCTTGLTAWLATGARDVSVIELLKRRPRSDCSRTALPQLACAAGLRGSHVRTRKFVPSCAVTDQRRSRPMNRAVPAAFIVAIIFLSVAPAQAGPCTTEIAWFEQAVRRSTGNPNAGPMARQTVAAQLDRQPTPAASRRAHTAGG